MGPGLMPQGSQGGRRPRSQLRYHGLWNFSIGMKYGDTDRFENIVVVIGYGNS